jgi:hypothetical protein
MIHNLGSKTYVGSLLGADSRSASANGSSFDLQGSNDAEGEAIVILDSEAGSGTSPTLDVKLQESSDDSTWSDISGATFTQVTDGGAGFEKISINVNDTERYLRAVATLGGTTPAFVFGVSLVYSKKYGN